MSRLVTALLMATSLAVGACKGPREDPRPETTVPTAPRTTPSPATTAPVDPYAIPPAIDAAYVERVLVELNRVYGDTGRRVIEAQRLDRSDLDPLSAIFNPPLLEFQFDSFSDLPTLDRALFKNPIGYRRMTVLEVITARPDCIFARVSIDVSAVVVSPPPDEDTYLTLTPKPADADPAGTNPTPWSMANESNARQDPCAS